MRLDFPPCHEFLIFVEGFCMPNLVISHLQNWRAKKPENHVPWNSWKSSSL